jgi:hypothetical protein
MMEKEYVHARNSNPEDGNRMSFIKLVFICKAAGYHNLKYYSVRQDCINVPKVLHPRKFA